MEVLRDKASMRAWSRAQRADGRRVGFVPTMGALHEGHLTLVREALARADRVVVSVYVNPSQFGPNEDLDRYPRDEGGDLAKLEELGVHAAFFPADLYDGEGQAPTATSSGRQLAWVEVEQLGLHLCGPSRPGFFRGIATVVTKLFHIVEPDVACFGQKDYQQLTIIRRLVSDLDFGIEIVGVPTVREADGLAASSRNLRLSAEDRVRARAVPASLELVSSLVASGDRDADALLARARALLESGGARVDYVALVDTEKLAPVHHVSGRVLVAVAAWFGDVRLIDSREIVAG
ncbi:MAG: pantoate--beta-alanine ligase [Deltaproteobacteria bacterium]|nr:pantoate--beta-alanine ligase [Deltaproteobacteria bacterium]MCB9786757.1 pantoate--beta-alanine ligase [Deltaproteobacteria bacterium]